MGRVPAGQAGAYQRILALQDIPLHIGYYLIKLLLLIVVVTASLLSSLPCLLLL